MAALLAIAGCTGEPGPTFDPAGPCIADGRAPGAYPDLEARLPRTFIDETPTSTDSGRHCTTEGLGTLAEHDLEEVRYAGATWDMGGGTGVSTVVFALPDDATLRAAWVAEFYETSARAGRKTSNIEATRVSDLGTGDAWRLDLINDLSFQTTVTWQDGPIVRAVLVATPIGPGASRAAHDDLVESVIRTAIGASPAPA